VHIILSFDYFTIELGYWQPPASKHISWPAMPKRPQKYGLHHLSAPLSGFVVKKQWISVYIK
jgi:hypothetical protein